MKPEDLEAILAVLEAHPRIASVSVGDLSVTFRDEPPQFAAAEPEGEPETLELPDGVFDPRKAVERFYAKHRKPPEAA